MTPKEKAKELVDKFICTISSECHRESYCERKDCKYKDIIICHTTQKQAKQCALITVSEILTSEQSAYSIHVESGEQFNIFWRSVKKEIKSL